MSVARQLIQAGTLTLGLALLGAIACAHGGSRPNGPPGIKDAATPPSLVGAKLPLLYYPRAVASAGIDGTVRLILAVRSDGRIDTSATTTMFATNRVFVDSLRVSLSTWHLRPARAHHQPSSGALPITIRFLVRSCGWPDSMTHQRVYHDSIPAQVTISICGKQVFGPLFVDPKAVRTVKVTLSGLWSDGFEDGYYTPCKSVNIHINPHGVTIRTMAPSFRGIDTAKVPLGRMIQTLGGSSREAHRYYVSWKVELTGPQRTATLAAYSFYPLQLLEVKRWEEKSCALK